MFNSIKNPCDDLEKELGAIPHNGEYGCPSCNRQHSENEDGYTVGGKSYPLVFNSQQGFSMDGHWFSFDEVHNCEECSIIYYFNNGN